MKPLRLAAEAIRIARSQPVTSTITALIVAAVCGVILSTTGQTVKAEQEVLGRIDDAGTRSIIINDIGGTAGIRPDAVDRIAALSTVESVIGLGPATDGRNSAIGRGAQPVAIRIIYGTIPSEIETSTWDQQPGSALIGAKAQQRVGFETAAGGLRTDRGSDYAVVGWFRAREPFEFLNTSLIAAIHPDDPDPVLRSIHILAQQPKDVAALTDAALSVLDPADPTSIGVQTSEALAQVRAAVQGELGRYGRQLVTLVLAGGLVLVGLNISGAVTSRRKDFGRRRALGASRPTIIAIVTLQTLTVALLGAAIGSAIASLLIERWTGSWPDSSFTIAVAALATITAAIAAIPPAILAANRDPVRILRVP